MNSQTKASLVMAIIFCLACIVMSVDVSTDAVSQDSQAISDETELVSALETDGTIHLTADIGSSDKPLTTKLTISSDTTITLDLNGHSIIGSSTNKTILENNGHLTLTDSSSSTHGTIKNINTSPNSANNVIVNNAGATLLISNISLINDGGAVIQNKGTCAIENGTVVSSTYKGYEGGSASRCAAVSNIDEGVMTINGGEFSSASQSALNSYSDLSVMNVYNGTFNGNGTVANGVSCDVSIRIHGGDFSSDPSFMLISTSSVNLVNYRYIVTELDITEQSLTTSDIEELRSALVNPTDSVEMDLVFTGSGSLSGNLRVASNTTLTIAEGANLTIGTDCILELDGKLINNGNLTIDGFVTNPISVTDNGAIYGVSSPDGGEYIIDSAMDLQWLAYLVNKYPSAVWEVCLESDITIPENIEFQMIGKPSVAKNYALDGAFQGTFNGNGHKIYNLEMSSGGTAIALFHGLYNATVTDLELVDVNIVTQTGNIAGLSAYAFANTTISNVSVSGTLRTVGSSYGCAAIVAVVYSENPGNGEAGPVTFVKCSSSASIGGDMAYNVGPIFGTASGTPNSIGIYNCSNSGNITAAGSVGFVFGFGHVAEKTGITIMAFKNTFESDLTYCSNAGSSGTIDVSIIDEKAVVRNGSGEWVVLSEGQSIVAYAEGLPYASLEDAVTSVSAGETIRLVDDCTCGTISISKEIELDLNGYTITSEATTGAFITVQDGGELTITDSSESGDGTITGSGILYLIQTMPGSSMHIDSGTFIISDSTSTPFYVIEIQGTATIDGGTFTAGTDSSDIGYALRVYNGGDLELNYATIVSTYGGILVRSTDGQTSSTTATIYDGDIDAYTYGFAVFGDGYDSEEDNDRAVLTILDVDVDMTNTSLTESESVCIGTNASEGEYGGHTIKIEGGTFNGNTGCYFPSYGLYTIAGGTFETSMYGIRIAAGILKISGDATIQTDVERSDSELTVDDKPTGIMGSLTIGKVSTGYVGDIEIHIDGGTLSNSIGNAITVYDDTMGAEGLANNSISLNLTGGTVTGDVEFISDDDRDNDSGSLSLTLDGGSIDGDLSIEAGMTPSVEMNSGTITGTVTGIGEQPTGTVTFPDRTVTNYYNSFVLPDAPEDREGYRFLGYSLTEGSDSAQYQAGDMVVTTGNVTVYEVWEFIDTHVVTITFPVSLGLLDQQIQVLDGEDLDRSGISLPEGFTLKDLMLDGASFSGPITSDLTLTAEMGLVAPSMGSSVIVESEGYTTISFQADHVRDDILIMYYLHTENANGDVIEVSHNVTGSFVITEEGDYAIWATAYLNSDMSIYSNDISCVFDNVNVNEPPQDVYHIEQDGDSAQAVVSGDTAVFTSSDTYSGVNLDITFSDVTEISLSGTTGNGTVSVSAVSIPEASIPASLTEGTVGIDVSVNNIPEYTMEIAFVIEVPEGYLLSGATAVFLNEKGELDDAPYRIDGNIVYVITNHNTPYYVTPTFTEVTEPDTPPLPSWDDDDDYVPIIPVVPEQSSSGEDTVKIVACAAAAVVAALIAAYLIIDRKH